MAAWGVGRDDGMTAVLQLGDNAERAIPGTAKPADVAPVRSATSMRDVE